MKNLSVLTSPLSRQLLLCLASCVFLFSLSHHTLFHSFPKVAEDLFSSPPFLEGHLAAALKGRAISVSSFLPAQNNLLHALSEQEKWCPPLSRNCFSYWAGSVRTMVSVIKGNSLQWLACRCILRLWKVFPFKSLFPHSYRLVKT